jgi:DNA-binding transcriptional ArsR family regulator
MKKIEILKQQQDEIFQNIAEILSGISSPVRIKLLHFLSQGPLTVEVLASKINQTVANTSMHLRKMLSSHLVTVTVQAQKRLYSLHPAVFHFWEACQNLSQQINPRLEINSKGIYGDIDWTESLKTTVKMAKNDEVILLDVRPEDEVSEVVEELNVINIPSSELLKNLSRLPKRKTILVFCRGRFCALSSHVVHELREHGYKAFRLNESWYALKNLS